MLKHPTTFHKQKWKARVGVESATAGSVTTDRQCCFANIFDAALRHDDGAGNV